MTASERAKLILLNWGETTPSEFAWRMWPLAGMHFRVSNQGRGACTGKAAWMCGGAYLGKLCKQKIARMIRRGSGHGYNYGPNFIGAVSDADAIRLEDELKEADGICPLRAKDWSEFEKARKAFLKKHGKTYE